MDKNPTCHAYYVTTGTWNAEPEPTARMSKGVKELEATHLFSAVTATPVDAVALKTIYRELERGVTREIEFTKTAVFPMIDGVAEAYLGLLAGSEFLSLISDNEGRLNRDLFYDNVRDYQGKNPVNSEIAATIAGENRGRFPLLNNGITIVARSISRTGEIFRISDFQIVNGCQTTHVLFQNRDLLKDSTFVPIKLVVTDDSEIITEVIKATNWQTAVKSEALESLTPIHKEIEDFYNSSQASVPKKDRVYYERRSKQYHFDPVPESNIVTLTAQTKSFVSMYLEEPHSHPRYYGELLKAYETRIFVADHKPAPYFTSGLAYVTVYQMFKQGLLDKGMRSYVYHVLMLLRVILMDRPPPKLNSNQATVFAVSLADKIRDQALCLATCKSAIDLIKRELKNVDASGRNPHSRLRVFTEALLRTSNADDSELALNDSENIKVGDIETGTLLWFDEFKGYGFIERDKGGDLFLHSTGLGDIPWKYLKPGSRIRFEAVQGPKSIAAKVTDVLQGS